MNRRRKGSILVICLVLIVLLGTVSGIAVKTVLRDRDASRAELRRRQVEILLEDGLRRAEFRRKADPAFSGEPLELEGGWRLTVFADEIEVELRDPAGKTILRGKRPIARP